MFKLSEETVTWNLNVDVSEANRQLGRFSTALYGIIGVLRIMGLPSRLNEVLRALQQLIATANMARTAIIQLYTATGPVGWALGGIAAISAGTNLAEQAMRELRSYG